MTVVDKNQYQAPERGAVALSLSQSGMTLTVGAGPFKWGGVDYMLDDDVLYVANADPTYNTFVCGYLTRVLADPGTDIEIVVDEIISDNVDVPVLPDPAIYETLMRLFCVNVPAGATDLDAVTVMRYVVTQNPAHVRQASIRGETRDFVPPTKEQIDNPTARVPGSEE